MNIVVVIDIYDLRTNGTVMTAYRFVNALKERGHTVKVVATGAQGEDCYELPERRLPVVRQVAAKQQIRFAKPVVETLVNAFAGADVVHLYLPFKLEKKARKLAERMGIPYTAAFHLQPENVTYNCMLGRSRLLPKILYAGFRSRFYRYCPHIHCPSLFIADQLRKNGYKSKLHVFSNGVDPAFSPAPSKKTFDPDRIKILCVGRYAREKRQDVLIKAIARSAYADKIELTLAGKGPCKKKLERLSKKRLSNPVRFAFFDQEQLIRTIRSSDLYVHPADVEIEAISCIEAFSCGVVPVIANSKKSATPQFALDDRSLFKAGSAKDLARKIDAWLYDPKELGRMSEEYAKLGRRYRLDYSIDKTEEMFKEAIADARAAARLTKTDRRRERQKFGKRSGFFRVCSWLLYYLIAVPALAVSMRCALGVRVKGKRNLRKVKGAVSVSNHVHMLDCAFNAIAMFNRKIVFTALESNFRIPVAGYWLKLLGTTPVPEDMHELPSFFRETKNFLKQGRIVHLYPEGRLINYYAGIRDFNRGAFVIACDAQVPVLPVVISWRERKGFYRLFGKTAPCATVTICPPIKPDYLLMKREMENDLMERCYGAMMIAYEDADGGKSVDFYARNGIGPSEYRTKVELKRLAATASESRPSEAKDFRSDESDSMPPSDQWIPNPETVEPAAVVLPERNESERVLYRD